jgi:hypothetical protein
MSASNKNYDGMGRKPKHAASGPRAPQAHAYKARHRRAP